MHKLKGFDNMNKKLAIIGFGHMGSAIIKGALKSGILSAEDITVADKSPETLAKASALGVAATSDSSSAVKDADTVIIAVKPGNLKDLAEDINETLPASAVLVSICAGKRLETLAEFFGKDAKIIRVMPNTPALVGEGMSALCANENVTKEELSAVSAIFASFGRAEILQEDLFDAVTAVSGSGPAYVYAFIDALMKYAVESGMTPEQSKIFAAQTVLGAAKMTLSSNESPQKLKENVCVPNGTTIEAINVFDERGFDDIIKDAAKACEERSRQISKE